MNEQRDSRTLVEEKDALSVYFEALLREAPTDVVEAPAPAVVRAEPVVVTAVAAPPLAMPVEAPVGTVTESAAPIVPEWGVGGFQALLFRVAGLTLAVPLVELSGVQEWDADAITPMPGHSAAYLGVTEYRGRNNVPVVDTAAFVLPPDRLARLTVDPTERVGRIVFIGDGSWGLACDEVAEVVTLGPDEVRWRTSRTKRRWLAGTVIEHMCAVLDPPVFADMLATGKEDEESGNE